MLRALTCAVAFMTRVPVPQLPLEERDLARAVGFFPWVGMLLAGACWLCSALLAPLGTSLDALCCVVLWAWLTGGLHLDGLADAVDGLAGGRGDPDRTLEVMRDSRIGAHGAAALALVLALKWAALSRALAVPGQPAWLAAPIVARLLATVLVTLFPYARARGLGSAFVRAGPAEIALATVALAPCALWLGGAWLLPAGLAALVALGLAWRFQRLLGGLTGDVYGACVELAEVTLLLGLAWGRG